MSNTYQKHQRVVRAREERLLYSCVQPSVDLISRALRNQLIIPDWEEFTIRIDRLYKQVRAEKYDADGK